MPAAGAYTSRIIFQVNDQEDGAPSDPVFRDSFNEVLKITRNGVAGNSGGGNPGTLTIPITEVVIAFTGLVRPGHVILRNLDGTNSIRYGPESAAAMVELGELFPGQFNIVSIGNGVVLRAIANVAPARMQIKAYEW